MSAARRPPAVACIRKLAGPREESCDLSDPYHELLLPGITEKGPENRRYDIDCDAANDDADCGDSAASLRALHSSRQKILLSL